MVNYLAQEISKQFESEIRIFVKDITAFRKKLKNLNAELVLTYRFNDYCYKPRKGSTEEWDPNHKTMRLRAWSHPETYSQILFSRTEILEWNDIQYKRTVYPEGKLELFRGEKSHAKKLLEDWDFKYWFTVEKLEGSLLKIKSQLTEEFDIALENIRNVGYLLEAELWGDIKDITPRFSKILNILGISVDDITFKSLPRIVAEKSKLI
jgi:adenylate cyclase class IV